MAVLHPLPQAPSCLCQWLVSLCFPLGLYTAVLSRSASGVPAGVGRDQTTVTVFECAELEVLVAMISCLYGKGSSGFFSELP